MKKYTNKKFILSFLIYTMLVSASSVVGYEMVVEDSFENFINSETIVVERKVQEKTLSDLELLEESKRAKQAGEVCRTNEAKKMRLEELAEEAKELQSQLDDPLM